MIIGNKTFESGTHIMAIVNVTPDSFFAQSRIKDNVALMDRVENALLEGAEIIDIGAQSTRPGHIQVSPEEEIQRLGNSIADIKRFFPGTLISVDTYYSKVADYALSQGADLVNDIWGLQYDKGEMAQVIAKYNAACCLMHNATEDKYTALLDDICAFLKKSVDIALKAKIDPDKICLDGGIGFAKNIDENWELLNNYDKLNILGYPLLLGTSRKRMFGGDVAERLRPTMESTLLACMMDVRFVRVHDVKENKEVIDCYNANHNRD